MAISFSSAAKTACEASGWELTNLSLHKLLYLSHMRFLGTNEGQPLIKTNFEAWKYGPVISPLYHEVKAYGDKKIPKIFNVTRNLKLPHHKLIRDIIDEYGDLPPGELVEITHKLGGAWDTYYEPNVHGVIIPNRAILLEYRRDPI